MPRLLSTAHAAHCRTAQGCQVVPQSGSDDDWLQLHLQLQLRLPHRLRLHVHATPAVVAAVAPAGKVVVHSEDSVRHWGHQSHLCSDSCWHWQVRFCDWLWYRGRRPQHRCQACLRSVDVADLLELQSLRCTCRYC